MRCKFSVPSTWSPSGAHYLFTIKGNQPGMHAQLAALRWRYVRVVCQTKEKGDGRAERRTLKGHRRRGRAGLLARRLRYTARVRPPDADPQEVVDRDRLRDHLADPHPGPDRRPCPLRPRSPGASRTA